MYSRRSNGLTSCYKYQQGLRTRWGIWDNAQEHGSFYCPSVTKLFNLSISTGIIPHKWKISSMVLIPKFYVSTNNSSNYRPISLLSVISKLQERHISSVVLEHLIEREILLKISGVYPRKVICHGSLVIISQYF